jgi:ubiquinone/menaquinone biosynthesis C-methylase UbiE
MSDKKRRVCPVSRAGSLDNKIRRWLQNPNKILGPYIKEGMSVLDLGCGPGFFSIELAAMVGKSGRVIAVDLQDGMLKKLRDKIQGTEFEERIILHKCEADKIGFSGSVDFVLAFYMVHEVPDSIKFFKEIKSILNPGGQILIVEPKLFHVSKRAFEATVENARSLGFGPVGEPEIFFSRAVVFRKK